MPAENSKWDRYLASLDPGRREIALAWVDSRPPAVRALFRRFPPGSTFLMEGRTAYIVGVAETDDEPGMLLSYTNPAVDYDGAFASRFLVCGEHFRS
jgi:hypothetical protein